jgi:hypothetical protein
MTTSGLVITLDPDPYRAFDAADAIGSAGPFTLGNQLGRCLVAALEADTAAEARFWHDWLATLPGVVKVDLAFVHRDVPVEETVHDC